ncbi:MAG: hypothetical protein GX898_02435 [Corynebacterium sp.]|nr:hypothetical protein [Corynebacterium sp.]
MGRKLLGVVVVTGVTELFAGKTLVGTDPAVGNDSGVSVGGDDKINTKSELGQQD